MGAGKTSLLHALMGELERVSGRVHIKDASFAHGFAYVGQETWIEAGSIRDNILFGAAMQRARYEHVLDVCAFARDLAEMTHGDLTRVGENGVRLSGGQKARLALCRACYAAAADADQVVYVLDDPLSAVDAHVAAHLYDKCIAGWLGDKTRVLTTHHVKYLLNADWIVVLDNGRIVDQGHGQQIVAKYQHALETATTSDNTTTQPPLIPPPAVSSVDPSSAAYMSLDEAEADGGDSDKVACALQVEEVGDERRAVTELNENAGAGKEKEEEEEEEEEREQGVVRLAVYKNYLRAAGVCLTCLTLLALTLMQGNLQTATGHAT